MPGRSCRAAFEAFEAWQTAGLNALNNRGQWPECLAEGKVVASQQKQAPHLRWSQAPPLPWRRPGSANNNNNNNNIYIYIFIIYNNIYIYIITITIIIIIIIIIYTHNLLMFLCGIPRKNEDSFANQVP